MATLGLWEREEIATEMFNWPWTEECEGHGQDIFIGIDVDPLTMNSSGLGRFATSYPCLLGNTTRPAA